MTRCPQLATVQSIAAVTICLSWPLTLRSHAQTNHGQAGDSSRLVVFDHPGGDAPNLEVNISSGMLNNVFGLGNAALEGVISGLIHSDLEAAESELAAEQISAVREVVDVLRGAVDEVKVRLYAEQSSGSGAAVASLVSRHYKDKLSAGGWNQVVYMSGAKESINVFLHWESGALQGVFVVAGTGRELVLVHATCDLSPERLKQAAEQITKIWLELGGRQELRAVLGELGARRQLWAAESRPSQAVESRK